MRPREPEVPREAIEEEVGRLREAFAQAESGERAIEQGDYAVVDFVGTVDGEPFQGGEARDYMLEIGGGRWIEGFEDQLGGARAGERRTVEIDFPDDYGAEELRGKHALFEVEVKDVKEKELPVADDAFAAQASEFETLAELEADIEEKLNPWMQPIYDNVELLLGLSKAEKKEGRTYHELIDLGYIQIEPLTYIRGRSIPNQFMIIDEAQNLTPHEVKTIITRAGDNTKIVLTGDPYQIDNPYVDAVNNGLTTVVERFKDESIAGHITLSKGERSALAERAANLL